MYSDFAVLFRELNWLISNISMRKDVHRSSQGEKSLRAPHILIAHAFPLDGTCRAICTYSKGLLAAHLPLEKGENNCLEDTRSIYMYSV